MKSISNIPDTIEVTIDQSALYVARESIQTCSRDFARALAVLTPEIDGIRTDASSRAGSVWHVLSNFMENPANRNTQLFSAIKLHESQRSRLFGLIDPFVQIGNERSAVVTKAADALLVAVGEGARVELQAWYEPALLRRYVEASVPFQRAAKFREKFGAWTWGADIVRLADRYSIEDCKNTAAEILALVDAQQRTWDDARSNYAELVKFLKRF